MLQIICSTKKNERKRKTLTPHLFVFIYDCPYHQRETVNNMNKNTSLHFTFSLFFRVCLSGGLFGCCVLFLFFYETLYVSKYKKQTGNECKFNSNNKRKKLKIIHTTLTNMKKRYKKK